MPYWGQLGYLLHIKEKAIWALSNLLQLMWKSSTLSSSAEEKEALSPLVIFAVQDNPE